MPNIMIVDGTGYEGERMRIIDFDWAGEEAGDPGVREVFEWPAARCVKQ